MKKVKLIAIIVLTFLIGVLTIQNIALVKAQLLFTTIELPLIVLLLLAAGLGFLIGLMVGGWYRTSKPSTPKPEHTTNHPTG